MRGGKVKGRFSEAEVMEVGKVGGGEVWRDMMNAISCKRELGLMVGRPKEGGYVLRLNLR